jgi:CheY-like chemotaxis protein
MKNSVAKNDPIDLLVVDDAPANLQLLTGLLREHGYGDRGALNGALAPGAVAQQSPDLILLDIKMPRDAGVE